MKPWFKHDFSARNDDKILELRAQFGWQGYGIYWAIIEYMAETNGGIDTKKVGAVSVGLGVEKPLLQQIIDYCTSVKLFYIKDKHFRSKRLDTHLKGLHAKREGGSIGGKKSANKRNASSIPSNIPSSIPSAYASSNASTDKIREDKIRENTTRVRAGDSLSEGEKGGRKTQPAQLNDKQKTEIANLKKRDPVLPQLFHEWLDHVAHVKGKPSGPYQINAHLKKVSDISDPIKAIHYSMERGYPELYADTPHSERTNGSAPTDTDELPSYWENDSPEKKKAFRDLAYRVTGIKTYDPEDDTDPDDDTDSEVDTEVDDAI